MFTNKEKNRQMDKEIERLANKEKNRQMDKEIERLTDHSTEKQNKTCLGRFQGCGRGKSKKCNKENY